jgi:predicted TIM-barrel fold metal-dependent hydrolase
MAIVEGGRPVTAPGWTGQPRTDLALFDCDIHHKTNRPDELFPYLPRVYREQITDYGGRALGNGYITIPQNAGRTDLVEGCDPASGAFKYTDIGHLYEHFKEAHLDVWNVDKALLTGGNTYGASITPDADYGAAMCRAFNDWTMEHWAAKDPERLLVAIGVTTRDPQRAVEEIDRLGDHPQVKAIVLPTGNIAPYGSRYYHPIWRACEERGLVVVIHPGNEGSGMAGAPTAVGYPSYYIENRMARPQMGMAHVVSLIAEGVFELFPRLKVLVNECDQFWAVGLMWHMDADWKSLREQTPWVKRLPSEYFRQHVRVGSQPMLEPETAEQFWGMLDALHADETLVYCSDWPHFDWDDPATTFPRLPERLHRRVFSQNARDLFGL